MKLVDRPCPICGPNAASSVFAEASIDPAKLDAFAFASRKMPEYMHHRLLACAGCDVLYASPAPTTADLSDAYEEAAFDSQEEARFASETYARLLQPILARLPSKQGALDVGTGDGAFLERLLALGFSDVAGVEPSAAPIAVAKPAVKPLIRHGIFRPEEHASGSLSLVTCFQTIEHLQDPLDTCRQFHRLLRPGGALLLIAHDRRALSAKVLGRRSPIFDLEHLQLFSHASARRLLKEAGFVDVEVRRVVNRYPLHYWVKLFPLPTAIKRPLVELLRSSGIGALPIPLAAGNLTAIGSRP